MNKNHKEDNSGEFSDSIKNDDLDLKIEILIFLKIYPRNSLYREISKENLFLLGKVIVPA